MNTIVAGTRYRIYFFDHEILAKDVIVEMARDGYKPASFEDTLFYPEEHHSEKGHEIVILADVCSCQGLDRVSIHRRYRHILCADRFYITHIDSRVVNLATYKWIVGYRFLGVPI